MATRKKTRPKYTHDPVLYIDDRGYKMIVKKGADGKNRYTTGCRGPWTAERCLEHWHPERYRWKRDGWSNRWCKPKAEVTRRAKGFTRAVLDYESGKTTNPKGPVVITRKSASFEGCDMTDVQFKGCTNLTFVNCTVDFSKLPDDLKYLKMDKCDIIGEVNVPANCDLLWYA